MKRRMTVSQSGWPWTVYVVREGVNEDWAVVALFTRREPAERLAALIEDGAVEEHRLLDDFIDLEQGPEEGGGDERA